MLIGNNLALLNHQHAIGSFEQGAAMGDYDHRFIRSHMDKIFRNMTLRGWIHCARWFIQKQN